MVSNNRQKILARWVFGFPLGSRYFCNPLARKPFREVSEWSKEHAWKVCIPLKGIEGSNPFLSAKKPPRIILGGFFVGFTTQITDIPTELV